MQNKYAVFDNYNARYSTHEEIAETFVSNDEFFTIAKNNHTFVLGPRGCGKTTMFKMLTTSAMYNWIPKTLQDDELKKNLPFIAVYIPSDELWKDQLNSLLSSLGNEKQLITTISNALINDNIFTNFCESIKMHIMYLDTDDKVDKERAFANELIKCWELEDCTSSLSSIKLCLGQRREELIKKINKYKFYKQYNNNYKPIELENYFFSDFLTSIRNGITAFENIFNDGNELKWALCFDELELISEDFFENLKVRLRIAPPNIVFKLSASPLAKFSGEAQRSHDYEVVKMWPSSHSEDKRYAKFCERIAIERIQSYRKKKDLRKNVEIDFYKIFGTLDYSKYALKEFNFKIDLSVKEEEIGSLTWNVFKELGKYDSDLRNEMLKRGIDPENPIPLTEFNSNTFIRKTKEIVINRLIFSKYRDEQFIQRTRKEYPIYYGKETIFKLCEGNPRFVIHIVNDILIKTDKYKELENLTFAPEEQANVIKNVSNRFNAMLNTYPTLITFNNKPYDLEKLIKQVGDYFDAEVNQGRFKMTPATCFFYDEKVTNKDIKKLIDIGVSLGAFIKIDKTADDINIDKSTRYRLSYLLHPHYKLPLRLFGSVKINKIIGEIPRKINQLKFD